MGRVFSDADIIDQTKCLKIKELLGYGYLKQDGFRSGTITWESGSSISIVSRSNTELQLSYTLSKTGKKVEYTIQVVSRPSNLGKGEVLFFLCPNSSRVCRALYLPANQKYFLSRHAFPSLMYQSQVVSKKYRDADRYFAAERKMEDVYQKGFRSRYAGQKTRKQLLVERLEGRTRQFHGAVAMF